jgi:hypothetical protein
VEERAVSGEPLAAVLFGMRPNPPEAEGQCRSAISFS